MCLTWMGHAVLCVTIVSLSLLCTALPQCIFSISCSSTPVKNLLKLLQNTVQSPLCVIRNKWTCTTGWKILLYSSCSTRRMVCRCSRSSSSDSLYIGPAELRLLDWQCEFQPLWQYKPLALKSIGTPITIIYTINQISIFDKCCIEMYAINNYYHTLKYNYFSCEWFILSIRTFYHCKHDAIQNMFEYIWLKLSSSSTTFVQHLKDSQIIYVPLLWNHFFSSHSECSISATRWQ